MTRKRLVNIIKWIWLLVVLAAGVYYFVTHYRTAIGYLSSIDPSGLIFSILFILLSRLLNVDLIRESVKEVGWKPTFREMFSLVSITQLGKYVPGGIWQFAARFGAYRENQLTPKKMGKAFLMENIWVGLGGLLGGLFFLLLGNSQPLLDRLGIELPLPVKGLMIGASLLAWLIGLFIFEYLLHREQHVSQWALRTLRLFLSHSLMYMTMGVSFYFLFADRSAQSLWFIVGGYTLSYLAGYLAIFAPGGIGVREVVSVAIFTGIASQGELATMTIVHRLLNTVIEFAMGLIGFLQSQRNARLNEIAVPEVELNSAPRQEEVEE